MVYDESVGLNNTIFDKFHGGVNLVTAPDQLKEGETPFSINWQVDDSGSFITVRPGSVKFNTTGLPKTCDTLYAWQPYVSGSYVQHLVASVGGTVYNLDNAGIPAVKFVGTTNSIWCFESAQDVNGVDFLYMVNGVDTPQRYNPVTDVIAAWPSAAPPTACTMIKSWRNFMVAAGDTAHRQRLYFSALGNPQAWTGTDFIDIGSADDETDPITWIDNLGADLMVFKKNSVWRMTAGPPTPVVTRVANAGCYGRFQSAELDGRLYFWAGNGLYSIDARTDTLIVPLRYESAKIAPRFSVFSNEDTVRVHATKDRRILVAFPQVTGGETWEYIPSLGIPDSNGNSTGAWFMHDYQVRAMANFLDTDGMYRVIAGSTYAVGGLYRVLWLFKGDIDEQLVGSTNDAEYQSPVLQFSPLEFYERLRRMNIEHKSSVTVDVCLDGESFTIGSHFTGQIDNQNADGNVGISRLRPELRARRFQYVLTGGRNVGLTYQRVPTVYSVECVVRGRKEH